MPNYQTRERNAAILALYRKGHTAPEIVARLQSEYPNITPAVCQRVKYRANQAGAGIEQTYQGGRNGGNGKAVKATTTRRRRRTSSKPKAKPAARRAGPRGGESTVRKTAAGEPEVRVNVWIPTELYQALRRHAAEEMQGQKAIIVDALRRHLPTA